MKRGTRISLFSACVSLAEVSGDLLPGLGHRIERVHGRDVWSYRFLFQQSRDSAEHVG